MIAFLYQLIIVITERALSHTRKRWGKKALGRFPVPILTITTLYFYLSLRGTLIFPPPQTYILTVKLRAPFVILCAVLISPTKLQTIAI